MVGHMATALGAPASVSLTRGRVSFFTVRRPTRFQGRVNPSSFRKSTPPLRAAISDAPGASAEDVPDPRDGKKKPTILPADEEDTPNSCEAFIDYQGELHEVLCCDYGFRTGEARMYQGADGQIPLSVLAIGVDNFKTEFRAVRQSFRYDEFATIAEASGSKNKLLTKLGHWLGGGVVKLFSAIDQKLEEREVFAKLTHDNHMVQVNQMNPKQFSSACQQLGDKLGSLQLDNDKVWEREYARDARGGAVETPWFIKIAYYSLCGLLDVLFENRPLQRFWFLETVARMPYFSYITMLHLYESFGWWRAGAQLRKIHFSEEWNELHHLQIMESLGGDRLWFDRFVAYHASILYYWVLVLVFLISPKLAYNFSELLEAHAVDTYGEFVDVNEETLKSLPPPLTALKYYRGDDLYMFDEFQTGKEEPRRPPCRTLYDVFCNIRDDEWEHVKTMAACQDNTVVEDLIARMEARNTYRANHR